MYRERDQSDHWDGENRRQVPMWAWAERVATIGGAMVALTAVFGVFITNPFMMRAAGNILDERVMILEGRFDQFERNQNLQLEVTMQEQIERLNEKRIENPGDEYIAQQRLMAIQACQEVKAKLGRPNTRCF